MVWGAKIVSMSAIFHGMLMNRRLRICLVSMVRLWKQKLSMTGKLVNQGVSVLFPTILLRRSTMLLITSMVRICWAGLSELILPKPEGVNFEWDDQFSWLPMLNFRAV